LLQKLKVDKMHHCCCWRMWKSLCFWWQHMGSTWSGTLQTCQETCTNQR